MELPAIISYVQFRNDNGFALLAAELDPYSARYTAEMDEIVKDAIHKKYGTFTISIGMLDPNEDPKGGQYIFVGDFVINPKYGRQFKADFYYQDTPTTEDGLKAFLMTLPNIKESRSDAIIRKFGVLGTIEVLDLTPHRLTEINGITEKRIAPIQKAWEEKKYLRELYTWLTTHKIPANLADKIYKEWGRDSLKILNEDPYRLVELRGIGFVTADKIAHQILKIVPLESRIKACMKYVIEENTWKNSNLCMPYSDLKKSVVSVISECNESMGIKDESSKYLDAIPIIIKKNLELFTVVKDNSDAKVYIYLFKIWKKEKYIAEQLWKHSQYKHKRLASCIEGVEL